MLPHPEAVRREHAMPKAPPPSSRESPCSGARTPVAMKRVRERSNGTLRKWSTKRAFCAGSSTCTRSRPLK
eukprot:3046947-Pleurochrysis_carterae.AAC.2